VGESARQHGAGDPVIAAALAPQFERIAITVLFDPIKRQPAHWAVRNLRHQVLLAIAQNSVHLRRGVFLKRRQDMAVGVEREGQPTRRNRDASDLCR
jgi:hypothetical protein